jgi:hypothetical protein
MGVATHVAAIKTKLGLATVNWADVKTYYDANLKSIADTAHAGEPVWDAFKTYFGSATFITDYVHKAITGTAAGFTNAASRSEMVEKTAMDMVIMQEVISLLYRASLANDKRLWDQGAATFVGADSGATTHGGALQVESS